MYDIIIIGCGVAGMTAALYAKRANKKVLVLEKNNYGGKIINTIDIENYPGEDHISGYDLATKLYNQIIELGVEIKYEEVINISLGDSIKEIETKDNNYTSNAIIIATGSKTRKLNIDLEDKFVGKGISYCATCDGSFYKDKDVCVVGGGNTALEEALYLSNIAKKVYLVHRRDKFRGDLLLVNKVIEKNNIEIIYNGNVTKLKGEEKLESIVIDDGIEIKVDGLFIAIGYDPNNDIFKNIVELDEDGYIIADELCHTNIDGIFVAGDNRAKSLRQLVTATSDGAIASTEAIKYLNK